MNTETPLMEPPRPYQEWKVLSVRSGKTVDNPKGPGSLTALYIDFEGVEDGWASPDGVYWRRKTGNEPNMGDSFWGTISVGEYGYRFDWDNTKAVGTSQQPSQPKFKQAAGQPQGGESQDARQRSIVRQHSEEMALRFLAIAQQEDQGVSGEMKGTPVVLFTPEWLEINLWPIVDAFQADASGNASYQEGGIAQVREEIQTQNRGEVPF